MCLDLFCPPLILYETITTDSRLVTAGRPKEQNARKEGGSSRSLHGRFCLRISDWIDYLTSGSPPGNLQPKPPHGCGVEISACIYYSTLTCLVDVRLSQREIRGVRGHWNSRHSVVSVSTNDYLICVRGGNGSRGGKTRRPT